MGPKLLLGIVVLLSACSHALTQQPTSSPAKVSSPPPLDVSIVRADQQDDDLSMKFTDDGFTAKGVTLDVLLRIAFNMEEGQFAGLPKWAHDKRFSIEGKVADSDISAWKKLSTDQMRSALLDLLRKQFDLVTYTEQHPLNVLALTIADGDSAKLEKARSDHVSSTSPPMEASDGRIIFNNAPLSVLCTVLSSQLGKKVVDDTEFSGNLHFVLRYDPASVSDEDRAVEALPSLFSVLKDELGLKLRPRKEVVSVVVVDQVVIPSS